VEQGPLGGQTGIGTGVSNWLPDVEVTQGPLGGQTGIGTGVSNWLFANVEPADSVTPRNRTKRKVLFTRNLLELLFATQFLTARSHHQQPKGLDIRFRI
jgi:hypothetical protein